MILFFILNGLFLILGIILLVHGFIKNQGELKRIKAPDQPFEKQWWKNLVYRNKEIKYGFYSLGTSGVFGSIYYISKLLN